LGEGGNKNVTYELYHAHAVSQYCNVWLVGKVKYWNYGTS